ncbi:MAG: PAS domain S-box protein [Candidatus Cloacimonetes bacterium]|jgi:PAS domain S-box-containing protein|nr:PAS domain S-box protein [Candidatus Cloacimonadota bacterium]MDD2505825.1 PAS domain S-box protein [Candidatus Cloacimonadota bacterium]MDD4147063.1 PAS domain S-box protein [Candidatus Cloacimonadota bacterium]MDD4559454.1 PAS domain S-box protein [Candidatus Cloacimonadota bacterium]
MRKLKTSFYRMLYDQSPVSLWVEDFSDVYSYIQALRKDEVKDIKAYFRTYPEKFHECTAKLRIVDVNSTTLRIFGASSKQELLNNIHKVFRAEAGESVLASIVAISEGRKSFEGQVINYDLNGNALHFRISWSIPGDAEEDFKRVIVAMQDITGLDRIRKELEEREALFRCIFEQVSEGMMLLDEKGKIFLVNHALENLSGLSAYMLVGSSIKDYFTTFSKTVNLTSGNDLVEQELMDFFVKPPSEHRNIEYSFFDTRHKLHDHRLALVPINSAKEKLYAAVFSDLSPIRKSERVTGILHQISHAVNTECSLDDLFYTIHQALSQVLDVTNFYIALYDKRSNIITFPYLVDEMNEDSSPVEADNNTSLTAQIISEERTLLLSEQGICDRTADKGFLGVICRNFLGVPLMLAGKVIGAIVVQSYQRGDLYDDDDRVLLESISEQIAYALNKKQADEKINVLFQAIEQAGEGILIFSPQGNIQYVNTIFERITSYRRIELLDQPFECLPFDATSRKEMQQSWLRVRSSQPWRGKVDMIRKDSKKITLDMVVKPVIDQEGILSSIIASCKDVTYEIMREEQQKRTQRLEAIGRLTGGIAHDFNNILSAIIGYTELAGDDLPPDSDAALNLVEVLKSSTRAKEMISHLISFSRQEESKTEVVELVDHVKESVRFLRSYLPRSIKIKENYTTERSTVIAVPGQIHQIIINLGTNAMHALHKDGAELSVAVEVVNFKSQDMQAFPELKQCQYLKVTVSDNGTGIDPAIMDHIFDPYFTTKSNNEGTGLGLSIVHSIVQSHHGAVRVDSTLGVGTSFYIYIPVYTPDEWHTHKQEDEEAMDIGGTETIMFVDDEPALVNVFRQGLMRLGYKVEGFTDPRKALEYFEKYPDKVDMLVTDTTMPYINGVDLAQRLMAMKQGLPVIICTGFTTLISVDDAREKGIKDFIMKPFKIRDIATSIRDAFNGEEKSAN